MNRQKIKMNNTKRAPLKRSLKQLQRTKLSVVGHSTTADLKAEIQYLVREIVMKRDKGCILRNHRHCGGEIGYQFQEGGEIKKTVLQADHLITRSNSSTFADTRLIVCVCRPCHGWKKWHEQEYNNLVKTIISKEQVELWYKCEEDRQAHMTYKMDWNMEIIALKKELQTYA